jgi:NTP pyrophosphatase (non-canonical NTP hydrolase)
MRSLSELELLIIRWAEARKIIPNAQPHTQLMKTVSELGELVDAEIKEDMAGIIDGVGDVLVTLVIYCDLRGITITQCLNAAYQEIKDRKGTLLANGLFVKDA